MAGATCATLVTIASGNAFAAADDRQQLNYDVYASGFHVVSAELDVDLSRKSRYNLRLGAYTHGMLARLAPWNGTFETYGWYNVKKQLPQPEMHRSVATWRKETETTEFLYNKNGSFREYRQTNSKKHGPQPVDPALAHDTTDVLSATLKVMTGITKTGKCEGKDEIFDGDRRYDLIFRHRNETVLKANALNVYDGPATECTVEVKPIAGKWHSKPRGWLSIQEQGRARGTMPTIWFAQMSPGEPAVPVKIRVKTEYGAFIMHLTGYKGAGKTLSLKKG